MSHLYYEISLNEMQKKSRRYNYNQIWLHRYLNRIINNILGLSYIIGTETCCCHKTADVAICHHDVHDNEVFVFTVFTNN